MATDSSTTLPADYYITPPNSTLRRPLTPAVNPKYKWLNGGTTSDQTIQVGADTLPGLALEDLSPADQAKGFGTPYYAAKTNMGDLAATVMAPDGAKVRLVDPATGQVVAEGTGAQGSQYIASLANQLSTKLGKKANWDIAVENAPGSGQYNTMQGDRTDKPRFTLLSAVKMIAPAAVGALVAGPLGAGALAGAAAAGGTSLLAGQSPTQALLNAAGVGIGAGVGSALGGAGSAAGGATGSTAGALGAGAADFTASELAGAVAPLTVTAGGSALGAGLGAGLGGALGASSGANGLTGSSGADSLGGTTVDEITVTAQQAARQGLSLSQMVAMGIPAAAAAAALAGVASGGATGAVTPTTPQTATVDPATTPDTTGLTQTPAPADPTSALDKALAAAKNNPLLTQRLLALGVGALAGASGSGDGKNNINSIAGTRASLDPVFSADLPAPTLAVRTPQAVNTDWATYGARAEQPFFSGEAETPASTRASSLDAHWAAKPENAVTNQRLAATTGYGGDFGKGGFENWIVNQPAGVKAQARQVLTQAGGSNRINFATGGRAAFAVRGKGTGRSDSIDAKLSDGEYVMDAETVSMLGDGSTEAGAKKLDQFRVNIRKHKGRNLAKGRFSVDARQPEAYLKGGRV